MIYRWNIVWLLFCHAYIVLSVFRIRQIAYAYEYFDVYVTRTKKIIIIKRSSKDAFERNDTDARLLCSYIAYVFTTMRKVNLLGWSANVFRRFRNAYTYTKQSLYDVIRVSSRVSPIPTTYTILLFAVHAARTVRTVITYDTVEERKRRTAYSRTENDRQNTRDRLYNFSRKPVVVFLADSVHRRLCA